MHMKQSTTVLMFGALHTLRRDRGLKPSIEITLPPEGRKAGDIGRDLNLPLELIGYIYCNHISSDLNQVIRPGDRMAFVPRIVPGPYRRFQGFPKPEKSPAATEIPRAMHETLDPVVSACPDLI